MMQFDGNITLDYVLDFYQKCICKPGKKRKNNTDSRRYTAQTQHQKKIMVVNQDQDLPQNNGNH